MVRTNFVFRFLETSITDFTTVGQHMCLVLHFALKLAEHLTVTIYLEQAVPGYLHASWAPFFYPVGAVPLTRCSCLNIKTFMLPRKHAARVLVLGVSNWGNVPPRSKQPNSCIDS